jgi:hypothetical protein
MDGEVILEVRGLLEAGRRCGGPAQLLERQVAGEVDGGIVGIAAERLLAVAGSVLVLTPHSHPDCRATEQRVLGLGSYETAWTWLRKARAHVVRLLDQRRDLPKRAEVRELNDRAVVKLATERKHLTDIIKMVAYQAESDLMALLRPHYARVDQEGRTLLHGKHPVKTAG